MIDSVLTQLQFLLPNHTYKAVKRRAEAMSSEKDRLAYLKAALANRERDEGAGL